MTRAFTVAASRWAYLLAAVPIVTDWIDTSHFPEHPREYSTEIVVGVLIAGCVRMLYREADRLRHLSETDQLTGLWNRRRFQVDLEAEVARAHRRKTPLSLCYLDVDRFKELNDRFGHAEGDRVLSELGGLLRLGSRRSVDRAYRLGGDEVAMILGEPVAASLAALKRLAVEHAMPTPALERHGVTLSIGAVALRPGETAESFVARADRLMYAAKNGRPGDEPSGRAARWCPGGSMGAIAASPRVEVTT
ncbi:MAG: GGDEF domain-containing protein [Acidobacteriota bacterium]